MLLFGIIGYIMDKVKVPVAPLVVGLILGQMLDASLHQSLLISGGSWWVFLQPPVSAVLLGLAALSLTSGTPLGAWIVERIKKFFGRGGDNQRSLASKDI